MTMYKLPGKRECGHAPLLRSSWGQSLQLWQSSASVTWPGQLLSPHLGPAPFLVSGCWCLTGLLEGLGALEGLEILEDLAVSDQISFSPHPGARGLLPAGSPRDGRARRAPAPAPGSRVLPAVSHSMFYMPAPSIKINLHVCSLL